MLPSKRLLTVILWVAASVVMIGSTRSDAQDCNSNGVPDANEVLLHEYKFGGNGDDTAGTANGTVGTNVTFSDVGVPAGLGQAAVFGVAGAVPDDVIEVSTLTGFGTGDFSIAFWVKRDNNDPGNADGVFDALSGTGVGWQVILTGDNTLNCRIDDAAGATTSLVSVATITGTDWHHVVLSVDRSELLGAKWYIDAVLDVSLLDPTDVPGNINPDQNLRIGTLDGSNGLDGQLAQAQFYGFALSAAQVQLLSQPGPLDCNTNGIPDECELVGNDCNTNGVPDDCEVPVVDALFAADVTYGAGLRPESVAVGDLDGDGHLDLAVANEGNNVSVLLNNGDGTFAADVLYGTGVKPSSVAVGDLDGDGDLDLVVANAVNVGTDDVSVLLNNGDGTFAADVLYGVDEAPRSVAVGDLDGDGDLDLAVANSNSHNVSVLRNNGDGTFTADVTYGAGPEPWSVAVGDLDGDGHLDLVVTNQFPGGVSVLLNKGDGTFATQVTYSLASFAVPRSVAVGDLDGDGDLDLATANTGSNNVSVLLNNGDGTFAAEVNYGTGTAPQSVAVGDLDGDGDLDLATGNSNSHNASVLLNNGDGTFAADVTYGTDLAPLSVAVGDLTGDGNLDLVLANFSSNNVSVLLHAPGDCDASGVPDECDIASGTSNDCNSNGVPDGCEIGVAVDPASGASSRDCNTNSILDGCDIAAGTSNDCNTNGIPDECEDCNTNGIGDECDIAAGTSLDCNSNGIPDECEDCNANGFADECDLMAGTSPDCNNNGIPDECEDCNTNGIADECDLAAGTSLDCNINEVPDECEPDFDGDGIIDDCDADDDNDGVPDASDVCNSTPPGVAVDSEGRPVGDIDQDCDTDLNDYALFQGGFTGQIP